MRRYVKFRGLRENGVVDNRVTLSRWIREQGFPPPVQLGPNSVAYPVDEVEAWLASRKRELLAPRSVRTKAEGNLGRPRRETSR